MKSITPKVIEMVPRSQTGAWFQAACAVIFYYCLRIAAYALLFWFVETVIGTDLMTLTAWSVIVGVVALVLSGIVGTFRMFMED